MNIIKHTAVVHSDAERYSKLRTLAVMGQQLIVHNIATAESFDAMIDAVDLKDLSTLRLMQDFAEVTTLLLHEAEGGTGFAGAVRMSGTGIYGRGFSWRNIHGIQKKERETFKAVVRHVLTYPEFESINLMIAIKTLCIDEEHEEDASVQLDFKKSIYTKHKSMPELMTRLLYGDLAIMNVAIKDEDEF